MTKGIPPVSFELRSFSHFGNGWTGKLESANIKGKMMVSVAHDGKCLHSFQNRHDLTGQIGSSVLETLSQLNKVT